MFQMNSQYLIRKFSPKCLKIPKVYGSVMFVIGPPQKEPTFTIMWRQSMLAPMGIFVIFVTSFVHQSMPLNFMNQDITENQKCKISIYHF